MTTRAHAAYEGTSGPLNPSMIRVLPAADINIFGSGAGWTSGFVEIRAHWNFLQQINIPGLTTRHVVLVSITELFQNPDTGRIDLPGIGAAQMYVRSVAPQNGVLYVSGYADIDHDLAIRISMLFVAP